MSLIRYKLERTHTILATDAQLHLLSKASIHGISMVPSMSSKPPVFQAVVNLLQERCVDTFIVDFEAGMWQGLRDVFEEPQIRGCAFHFGQALFRKVQELGIQRVHSERDDVYRILRKTFSLPLLPADDIRPVFEHLKTKSDTPQTDDYFIYINNTWMTNDMWPVESWSQYGRSVRTNNDCEGWHNLTN